MNIKELAEQAGFYKSSARMFWYGEDDIVERFAELVAASEREACAELCDAVDAAHEGDYVLAKWCAEAIRARGEKMKDEDDDIQEYKKPWVGLTDKEIYYIWSISPGDWEDKFALPRAIEAKLKEKNT